MEDFSRLKSRGIRLERLPSGKLDACEILSNDPLPDKPLWLTCDYCLQQADRLWMYPYRGFCCRVRGGRLEFPQSLWAMCVYCQPLRSEPQVLAARCQTLADVSAELATVTFTVLNQCFYGDPQYWESGQPKIKEPK